MLTVARSPVVMNRRQPIGILAAVLALTIAIACLTIGQDYALVLAGQYLRAVAYFPIPVKWEHLTRIYNLLFGIGLTDITFRMTE